MLEKIDTSLEGQSIVLFLSSGPLAGLPFTGENKAAEATVYKNTPSVETRRGHFLLVIF
jgi:hypothetical protein